jgi:hypothetical protein
MHRKSTIWLGLGCLVAVSCGAPAELDEGSFPDVYTDDSTGNAGAGAAPLGGSGGASSTAGAGSTVGNTGGAGVAQQGGSAGASPVGGTGGSAPVSSGGGCPDDITQLFNRPIEQGGCAGSLCHIPGATAPDLISPNPEQRLLNIQSSGACGSRPYISATESLVAEKIAGNPPPCGLAMPFLMPASLSAADEACILAWIDEVKGG